ncbi:MAG: LamG domain-containing protein [Spirochaetales bacterium]|nr:LamG domain-containing protein [Spirochaetales bacterium]
MKTHTLLRKSIALAVVCLISAAAFTQCASPQVIEEMVGWWEFDETSGTVAKDSSGKSVDCNLEGKPAWGKGAKGGCLTLDGLDTNGFIEGNFELPAYTVSLWFKTAPGVMHGILMEMQFNGGLRYLHRFPLGQSGGTDVYTDTVYNDGQWHHAALVKAPGSVAIYVDGEPVGTFEDESESPEDAFNVSVGCLDNERSLQRQFADSIDDLRIYNAALSLDQIKGIMNS